MKKKSNNSNLDTASRIVSMLDNIETQEVENIISYIAGIADATARMKQREKNER